MLTFTRTERAIVRRKIRCISRHLDDLEALSADDSTVDARDFQAAITDLRTVMVNNYLSAREVALAAAVGQADLAAIAVSALTPPDWTPPATGASHRPTPTATDPKMGSSSQTEPQRSNGQEESP